MLLYSFIDSLLSFGPKKIETEKEPKAADFLLFSPHVKRSMGVMYHELPFLRQFDANRRESLYVL